MISRNPSIRLFALLLSALALGSACGWPSLISRPTAAPTTTATPSEQPSSTPLPSPTASLTPPAAPPSPSATPLLPPQPLQLKAGQALQLRALRMFSAQRGWGIGRDAEQALEHVLITLDGGQTWADRTPPAVLAQSSPSRTRLTAHFGNDQSAWVTYYGEPGDTQVTEPLVVWATTDGGQTWSVSQPLALDDLPAEFIVADQMGFSDAQHGWLMVHLGAGMNHDYLAIFTTADGGSNWQRVVDPDQDSLPMSCSKTGLAFLDPQNGWVSGDCHGVRAGLFLYATHDGGLSWQEAALPAPVETPDAFTSPEMYCGAEQLSFSDRANGRLVVRCTSLSQPDEPRAWLYRSADGGKSWESRLLPTPFGTLAFLPPAALTAWWLGSQQADGSTGSTLYATLDGGKSWPLVFQTNGPGQQADFIDSQTGWLIVNTGEAPALIFTQDGGQHWQEIKPAAAP